jgi:hypothetical protein
MFISDVHHDSIYCNRELEQEHLEEAAEKDALICYYGDLFDAMQGRFDPRRSMEELRPEYRRSDYYDFVVDDVAEFLAPSAERIALLGRGNHESSVLKNSNTDLLDRLAYKLSREHKSSVKVGGFGGWLRLLISTNGVARGSVNIKYFHGAGSDAPVTRGVIQTNRQAVYLPDANVVINGHNHQSYYVAIPRERLSNKGRQHFDIQHHIRIPGYKMDYADGTGGWAVETGKPPKPQGVFWMKLSLDKTNWSPKLKFVPDISGGIPMTPVRGEEIVESFVYPEDSEYP